MIFVKIGAFFNFFFFGKGRAGEKFSDFAGNFRNSMKFWWGKGERLSGLGVWPAGRAFTPYLGNQGKG